MLYCEKCQVVSMDENRCPLCGGKKLRQVRPNDPVMLLTVGEAESRRIAAAFDDTGIPHMERSMDSGSVSSIVLGQSRCAQMRVFVPFGDMEHARDILHGIGALKDDEDEPDGSDQKDQPAEDESEKDIPMSRGRRLVIRIFSILLFITLIWAVVSAADSIISSFKSAFHLFQ